MGKKIARIAWPLAAVLSIAGCGGGGDGGSETPAPSDPLAAYKNQTIEWGGCDRYLAENEHAAKLGARLQCADIKAPLDYAKPDGARISLSMLRVLASEAPEKKPNLFFNPGGPGGDGQMVSLWFSSLLSDGSKNTVLGKKYREISSSYNFVGFSPRGVGASTNILCAGNEWVYPKDTTKWGGSAENIRRITDGALYTATNCQKSPVADYINTDATARDMDLMRHLLGDEKLHYYGISYGTWLGFWYAGLFPERVGPMVLDSNMNFNQSIHEASISYTKGQIHTFKEFIAPYAARHDDILGLGKTAKEVIAGLNSIGHETTQALLDLGIEFRAEREKIPKYLASIKMAIETQKLVEQEQALDEIHEALTENPYIADPDMDQEFKALAAGTQEQPGMVDLIAERRKPGFYMNPVKRFALDNSDSVFNTVVCNDEPLHNKDQAYWVDTGFALAASLPIISTNVAAQPCLSWQRPADIRKPSMDSLKNAALLMVQSQFDVPTPLSGAKETFDKLPAASMVYVKDEGAHGLLMYQTECVDLTVMDHLLGKKPGRRLTECEGKPLPLDAASAQSGSLKSARSSAPVDANFENPELAQTLMDKLRKASR